MCICDFTILFIYLHCDVIRHLPEKNGFVYFSLCVPALSVNFGNDPDGNSRPNFVQTLTRMNSRCEALSMCNDSSSRKKSSGSSGINDWLWVSGDPRWKTRRMILDSARRFLPWNEKTFVTFVGKSHSLKLNWERSGLGHICLLATAWVPRSTLYRCGSHRVRQKEPSYWKDWNGCYKTRLGRRVAGSNLSKVLNLR